MSRYGRFKTICKDEIVTTINFYILKLIATYNN